MALDVPVVLFIYKRPHLVEGLIKNLRGVRSKKIWLVSDGPKIDQEEEAKLCSEVRERAEALIDWPCHVKKTIRKIWVCGKELSRESMNSSPVRRLESFWKKTVIQTPHSSNLLRRILRIGKTTPKWL
jgi:hypothetical protein